MSPMIIFTVLSPIFPLKSQVILDLNNTISVLGLVYHDKMFEAGKYLFQILNLYPV